MFFPVPIVQLILFIIKIKNNFSVIIVVTHPVYKGNAKKMIFVILYLVGQELKEYLRTTRRKKKNTFFENFGRKVACIANPDTNSIGMDASPPQISSEAEEVLREMNSLTQQSDPFGKLI